MTRFELRPGDVCFFHALADDVARDRKLAAYCRSIMSEEEIRKTERYIFEKDRNACLATRALVRDVLSRCTGIGPSKLEFIHNAWGKPTLKQGLTDIPVRFNLSHAGGHVVCAITLNADIGVDIEDARREIDVRVADRFFSPSEAEFLKQCPAGRKQSVFYDFWTLKESYIKARGKGLSIGLDTFSFDISSSRVSIRFEEGNDDSPDQWRFFRISPTVHCKAAIAVRTDGPDFPLRSLSFRCVPFRVLEKE